MPGRSTSFVTINQREELMPNPYADYLSNMVAAIQKNYDAKYEDDVRNFNEGCAGLQPKPEVTV